MNNVYLFHFSASICENMQNCCRIKGNFQFSVQGQLFQKMIMEKSKNVNHHHFPVRSEGKTKPEVMSFHWSISLLSLILKSPRSTHYTGWDFVCGLGYIYVLATEKSRDQRPAQQWQWLKRLLFSGPWHPPTHSHFVVKRSRKRRNGEILSKDALELWGPRRGVRGWEAWSERRRPPSPPPRAFLSLVTSWQMLHQLMRAQFWCEWVTFDDDDYDD